MASWVYQPGNGTSYEFTIVRLPYPIPGNPDPDHYALVWIRYTGALTVQAGPGGFLHPSYLIEKANVRAADAFALAPAIAWAVGNEKLPNYSDQEIAELGLDPHETPGRFRREKLLWLGCAWAQGWATARQNERDFAAMAEGTGRAATVHTPQPGPRTPTQGLSDSTTQPEGRQVCAHWREDDPGGMPAEFCTRTNRLVRCCGDAARCELEGGPSDAS